jgi:hypothetical protein
MSIELLTLILTGPTKHPARLQLDGKSHLVFGPTDTGKSYILECLRFGLGGSVKPHNIGYSEGYTTVAIQLSSGGVQYTFFRSLMTSDEVVYEGLFEQQPQADVVANPDSISELLPKLSSSENKKLLIKSGVLGNFTAGDLRRISLFDEIETLNKVQFIGTDTNLQMRNRASVALILTGIDDSSAVLVPSSKEKLLAKGHAEALEQEILALKEQLPAKSNKLEVKEALDRVAGQISDLNSFLKTKSTEILALRKRRTELQLSVTKEVRQQVSLLEARARFVLLDNKYLSDLERLEAIGGAASIIDTFSTRPCPFCLTDVSHQKRHVDDETDQMADVLVASLAEIQKIVQLREGLNAALADVDADLVDLRIGLSKLRDEELETVRAETTLLEPSNVSNTVDLSVLVERKTELSFLIRDLEKLEVLNARKADMLLLKKRTKQKIERDVSQNALALSNRIKALLLIWGVPNVDQIFFEEAEGDIHVNQRLRISYGKGTRGIFLTAYVVALMELALEKSHPHLGFVAIDSPVVTYKDPKYGQDNDSDATLGEDVKDRLYAWLADRTELGQVILLENDDPIQDVRARLAHTEFFGIGCPPDLRQGFFPLN